MKSYTLFPYLALAAMMAFYAWSGNGKPATELQETPAIYPDYREVVVPANISHMGFIHFLPALPDAWAEGSVNGLRAKGNFEVDMVWAEGQLKEATIVSNVGGPCNLRYGDMTLKFNTAKGKTYKVVVADGKLKRQ